MDEHPVVLGVQVAVGPDGDAEEVAQATLQLRRELLDLDIDAVEVPGAGEPPPGSRAVDVATLGALVVNVADPQLLAAVVAAVRSWLAGSPGAASSCSSAAMSWSYRGVVEGAAAAGRRVAGPAHGR